MYCLFSLNNNNNKDKKTYTKNFVYFFFFSFFWKKFTIINLLYLGKLFVKQQLFMFIPFSKILETNKYER